MSGSDPPRFATPSASCSARKRRGEQRWNRGLARGRGDDGQRLLGRRGLFPSRFAQAEIIGLIFILLFLAVGFLFYVKFSFQEEDEGLRETYERKQLGITFVTSLPSVTVACGSQHYPVRTMIETIATTRGTAFCSSSMEDALSTKIKELLNATLDEWGVNYRLVIARKTGSGEQGIGLPNFTNPNIPLRERCDETKPRLPDAHLLSLHPSPGSVEIRLEQC